MDKKLEETNTLLEKLISRSSLRYKFLIGIVQGLGATLGLAVIIGLIGYTLSKVELIPVIGSWLSTLVEQILDNLSLRIN